LAEKENLLLIRRLWFGIKTASAKEFRQPRE
jgi:hypothetical protein